ncbi:streptococcal hemagglutinin-like [Watersipora subatra]|uniref:streptococcal hemagglutinin-like n=1 Tax=Watersipora subatra TaxID=2589382 RepID=UPI00355BFC64
MEDDTAGACSSKANLASTSRLRFTASTPLLCSNPDLFNSKKLIDDNSLHKYLSPSDDLHSQSVAYAPDPNIPHLPLDDMDNQSLVVLNRLMMSCKSPLLLKQQVESDNSEQISSLEAYKEPCTPAQVVPKLSESESSSPTATPSTSQEYDTAQDSDNCSASDYYSSEESFGDESEKALSHQSDSRPESLLTGTPLKSESTVYDRTQQSHQSRMYSRAKLSYESIDYAGTQLSPQSTVYNGTQVSPQSTEYNGTQLSPQSTVYSGNQLSMQSAVYNGTLGSLRSTDYNETQLSSQSSEYNGTQMSPQSTVYNGTQLSHPSTVSNGTQLSHQSTVYDGTQLSHQSTVYNGTQLSPQSTVYNGTQLSPQSIVYSRTKLSHQSTVYNGTQRSPQSTDYNVEQPSPASTEYNELQKDVECAADNGTQLNTQLTACSEMHLEEKTKSREDIVLSRSPEYIADLPPTKHRLDSQRMMSQNSAIVGRTKGDTREQVSTALPKRQMMSCRSPFLLSAFETVNEPKHVDTKICLEKGRQRFSTTEVLMIGQDIYNVLDNIANITPITEQKVEEMSSEVALTSSSAHLSGHLGRAEPEENDQSVGSTHSTEYKQEMLCSKVTEDSTCCVENQHINQLNSQHVQPLPNDEPALATELPHGQQLVVRAEEKDSSAQSLIERHILTCQSPFFLPDFNSQTEPTLTRMCVDDSPKFCSKEMVKVDHDLFEILENIIDAGQRNMDQSHVDQIDTEKINEQVVAGGMVSTTTKISLELDGKGSDESLKSPSLGEELMRQASPYIEEYMQAQEKERGLPDSSQQQTNEKTPTKSTGDDSTAGEAILADIQDMHRMLDVVEAEEAANVSRLTDQAPAENATSFREDQNTSASSGSSIRRTRKKGKETRRFRGRLYSDDSGEEEETSLQQNSAVSDQAHAENSTSLEEDANTDEEERTFAKQYSTVQSEHNTPPNQKTDNQHGSSAPTPRHSLKDLLMQESHHTQLSEVHFTQQSAGCCAQNPEARNKDHNDLPASRCLVRMVPTQELDEASGHSFISPEKFFALDSTKDLASSAGKSEQAPIVKKASSARKEQLALHHRTRSVASKVKRRKFSKTRKSKRRSVKLTSSSSEDEEWKDCEEASSLSRSAMKTVFKCTVSSKNRSPSLIDQQVIANCNGQTGLKETHGKAILKTSTFESTDQRSPVVVLSKISPLPTSTSSAVTKLFCAMPQLHADDASSDAVPVDSKFSTLQKKPNTPRYSMIHSTPLPKRYDSFFHSSNVEQNAPSPAVTPIFKNGKGNLFMSIDEISSVVAQAQDFSGDTPLASLNTAKIRSSGLISSNSNSPVLPGQHKNTSIETHSRHHCRISKRKNVSVNLNLQHSNGAEHSIIEKETISKMLQCQLPNVIHNARIINRRVLTKSWQVQAVVSGVDISVLTNKAAILEENCGESVCNLPGVIENDEAINKTYVIERSQNKSFGKNEVKPEPARSGKMQEPNTQLSSSASKLSTVRRTSKRIAAKEAVQKIARQFKVGKFQAELLNHSHNVLKNNDLPADPLANLNSVSAGGKIKDAEGNILIIKRKQIDIFNSSTIKDCAQSIPCIQPTELDASKQLSASEHPDYSIIVGKSLQVDQSVHDSKSSHAMTNSNSKQHGSDCTQLVNKVHDVAVINHSYQALAKGCKADKGLRGASLRTSKVNESSVCSKLLETSLSQCIEDSPSDDAKIKTLEVSGVCPSTRVGAAKPGSALGFSVDVQKTTASSRLRKNADTKNSKDALIEAASMNSDQSINSEIFRKKLKSLPINFGSKSYSKPDCGVMSTDQTPDNKLAKYAIDHKVSPGDKLEKQKTDYLKTSDHSSSFTESPSVSFISQKRLPIGHGSKLLSSFSFLDKSRSSLSSFSKNNDCDVNIGMDVAKVTKSPIMKDVSNLQRSATFSHSSVSSLLSQAQSEGIRDDANDIPVKGNLTPDEHPNSLSAVSGSPSSCSPHNVARSSTCLIQCSPITGKGSFKKLSNSISRNCAISEDEYKTVDSTSHDDTLDNSSEYVATPITKLSEKHLSVLTSEDATASVTRTILNQQQDLKKLPTPNESNIHTDGLPKMPSCTRVSFASRVSQAAHVTPMTPRTRGRELVALFDTPGNNFPNFPKSILKSTNSSIDDKIPKSGPSSKPIVDSTLVENSIPGCLQSVEDSKNCIIPSKMLSVQDSPPIFFRHPSPEIVKRPIKKRKTSDTGFFDSGFVDEFEDKLRSFLLEESISETRKRSSQATPSAPAEPSGKSSKKFFHTMKEGRFARFARYNPCWNAGRQSKGQLQRSQVSLSMSSSSLAKWTNRREYRQSAPAALTSTRAKRLGKHHDPYEFSDGSFSLDMSGLRSTYLAKTDRVAAQHGLLNSTLSSLVNSSVDSVDSVPSSPPVKRSKLAYLSALIDSKEENDSCIQQTPPNVKKTPKAQNSRSKKNGNQGSDWMPISVSKNSGKKKLYNANTDYRLGSDDELCLSSQSQQFPTQLRLPSKIRSLEKTGASNNLNFGNSMNKTAQQHG